MSQNGGPRAFYPVLAAVFLAMLVIMFLFELAKQLLDPDISIWESNAMTIVFTSIIAIALVYFPLRASSHGWQNARDELLLRQAAEEKLRKSEAGYRSFVESVDDSIYTVDRNCSYLQINSRHLLRQGISPETYLQKNYGDFHTPAETRLFEEQVKRVVETKNPVKDEYEKSARHFLRKLNPVIDPLSNEVMAVTVISSDITDRILAEKHLEAINLKLNLLNDITRHDILNQLAALGSILAIAGQKAGEAETRRLLAKSEQIIDTIHAQILFARDYQKIGVDAPQWQDIVSVIGRAQASLKEASVNIDESCYHREIYADPLLEKVFFNLLENAVRYAGGPGIRFSCSEGISGLILVCEDNGPGIPPEDKEKIFQRGFGKHTGLGLFLIRGILSMTGIMIRENGVFGHGSRFEMTIPPGAYRRGGSQ